MEYMIISADTSYSLESQLSVFLNSGWQPIGGVSVAAWAIHGCKKTCFQYSQALIKKDEWDE